MTEPASATVATPSTTRAVPSGFAAAPAIAHLPGGSLALTYLDFDGESDQLLLTTSPTGDTWSAPVPLSDRGALFPPTIAPSPDGPCVAWVQRTGPAEPAESARFDLWLSAGKGSPRRLAVPDGARPYAPAACAAPDGAVWIAHETWDLNAPSASAQAVRLSVHRVAAGQPDTTLSVPPAPTARAPRACDPAIAASTGAIHLVWWSPNAGEVWERPGERAGTTAEDLARLSPDAGLGPDDGAATGSDVWYAAYSTAGATWTEPIRLNQTPGWHLHPTIAVGDDGRVWITWAAVTRREIYGELNSDVPYVQTALARARRAMWFREARPAVRVLQDGLWHAIGDTANSQDSHDAAEPDLIWRAGHSLFPTIHCVGSSPVLVIRRYGAPQAATLDTGEQRMKLRAFETGLLTLSDSWSEPHVLHEPGQGGILARPSVSSTAGALAIAWQSDEGTRNHQSTIRLARPEPATAPSSVTQPEAPKPFTPTSGAQASRPASGTSTPTGTGTPSRTLFGNIHMHTEHSFCRRPTSYLLDFNYRWAQTCMRQDFAVLTDHAETKSAHEWWLNRKTAAFFTTPSFAALLGYEWTTRFDPQTGDGHGHLDVYFRGDPPRFWPANAVESSTAEGLWDLLATGEAQGHPAFTVAHHPSVTNFRRSWKRWGGARFEPVVEIHQDRRGSFERPGAPGTRALAPAQYAEGHWVSDALARGHRLGFVSGGDHMGISMTAVPLPAGQPLTRATIFDAIRAQRCYATTGSRILVDLTPLAPGHLSARIDTPSPIRRAVLVQDGVDTAVFPGAANHLDLSAPLTATAYAYLRVELEDGEMAWTSPVFLERRPKPQVAPPA